MSALCHKCGTQIEEDTLKLCPACRKKEHPNYIQLYRAVNGWQTMFLVWDLEDLFYDVEGTGFGPYGHSKEGYDQALAEGKQWAQDEGVEFKTTPFEPLKDGEPANLLECLKQDADKSGKPLLVVDLDKGTTETYSPQGSPTPPQLNNLISDFLKREREP